MKTIFISLVLLVALAGCGTIESVQQASSVTVAAPLVVSFVAYEGSRNTLQQGAISIGTPSSWYSEGVTRDELMSIAVNSNHKFHAPWKYMGTRNDYHYLVVYPFLDFRRIYRIHKSEYEVDDTFALTGRSSKWRDISVYPDDWFIELGKGMQIELFNGAETQFSNEQGIIALDGFVIVEPDEEELGLLLDEGIVFDREANKSVHTTP